MRKKIKLIRVNLFLYKIILKTKKHKLIYLLGYYNLKSKNITLNKNYLLKFINRGIYPTAIIRSLIIKNFLLNN